MKGEPGPGPRRKGATSEDDAETPAQRSAIFLSEYFLDLNEGAGFLNTLSDEEGRVVRDLGIRSTFEAGAGIFHQGSSHTGVWVIETGRVRTFYAAPSGREITLAYWSPGHFVGGPEVFGRGRHVWSADAIERCELLFLAGTDLLHLVRRSPDVAVAVIQGLVAKGKCYSALIQMLGTRTVSERLRQFLVILADTNGERNGDRIIVKRSITYEQIATIVGATRQYVTQSLDRLRNDGVLQITRSEIVIYDLSRLEE